MKYEDIVEKLSQMHDAQFREELGSKIITVEGNGGFVKVKINLLVEIVDITIDESIFTKNDKVLLERLVVETVNSAIQKAKTAAMAHTLETITGKEGALKDIMKSLISNIQKK
jgi:DNA-binding protein YbaB